VSRDGIRNVLVVANATVAGRGLNELLKRKAEESSIRVTVVCPVSQPREGYVVYEDTRRAAAGRRLDRTLMQLRESGIAAHGFVVEADPVQAVRDAVAQMDVDEVVVSTYPEQKSGWLRRNAVDRIRDAAGDRPVEHVVVDLGAEGGVTNVLVVANETVVGKPLLDRIRERAERSPASFLIISPQSDVTVSAHPEAERRLRRALAELRGDGIDAHGQVAHPDPYTAIIHAVRDEGTDEIIISTFPGQSRSSWLRGDLVERVRKETGLPVEHVEVEPSTVGAGP
jgi:ribosome-associated translation inhibitor RaiA